VPVWSIQAMRGRAVAPNVVPDSPFREEK